MTHPLTPREKVAQIIKEKVSGPHFTDPSFFVEMEQDRFAAADAILTALASGSGDHAELAKRVAEGQRLQKGPYTSKGVYRHDDIAALLAENAALRAAKSQNEDDWAENLAELRAESQRHLLRATEAELALSEHRITADLLVSSLKADRAEAERKMAEAVGLKHLTDDQIFAAINAAVTITRDRNGVDNGAVCISPEKFRTFLNKEAERG